jgi:hypothetical protein
MKAASVDAGRRKLQRLRKRHRVVVDISKRVTLCRPVDAALSPGVSPLRARIAGNGALPVGQHAVSAGSLLRARVGRFHFRQVVFADFGLTHRRAVVAGFRNIGFEGRLSIVTLFVGLRVARRLACVLLLTCHIALLVAT